MVFRKIDPQDAPQAFLTRGYAYGEEKLTPLLWLGKFQDELINDEEHGVSGFVSRAKNALLKLSVSGTSMQTAFGRYGKIEDFSLKELFTTKISVKVIDALRNHGKDELAGQFIEMMFGCREYTIYSLKKLRDNAHVKNWVDDISSSKDDAFLKRAYHFQIDPDLYPADEKTTPYVFLEKLNLQIIESVDSDPIMKESEIFQTLADTVDKARLALMKLIGKAAGIEGAFEEFNKSDEDAILKLKEDKVYVSSVFFNANHPEYHREFTTLMRDFDAAIISHLGDDAKSLSSRSLS